MGLIQVVIASSLMAGLALGVNKISEITGMLTQNSNSSMDTQLILDLTKTVINKKSICEQHLTSKDPTVPGGIQLPNIQDTDGNIILATGQKFGAITVNEMRVRQDLINFPSPQVVLLELILERKKGTKKSQITKAIPLFVEFNTATSLIDACQGIRESSPQSFELKEDITSGSGEFVVPEGITVLQVSMVGGGGGGGACDTNGGEPGFAGKLVSTFLSVTPGERIPYNIGLGGRKGWSASDPNGFAKNGETSTFGTLSASGGKGGRYGRRFCPGTNLVEGISTDECLSRTRNKNRGWEGESSALGSGGAAGTGRSNGGDGEFGGGGGSASDHNGYLDQGGHGGDGRIMIYY